MAVSRQRLAVSRQRLAVSRQRLAVSRQRLAVSRQRLAVSLQQSAKSRILLSKARSLKRSGKRVYGRAFSTLNLPDRTARKDRKNGVESGSTGEHSQPSIYLTEPQGKLKE